MNEQLKDYIKDIQPDLIVNLVILKANRCRKTLAYITNTNVLIHFIYQTSDVFNGKWVKK